MATFRRALTPGATYFFTVNTYQRQRVLTDKPFFLALKQSIRRVREAHPFKIEALVLLPDHLHCIWALPGNDADYALRWNVIKHLASQQTRDVIRPEVSKSRKKRREIEHMRGQVLSRKPDTLPSAWRHMARGLRLILPGPYPAGDRRRSCARAGAVRADIPHLCIITDWIEWFSNFKAKIGMKIKH